MPMKTTPPQPRPEPQMASSHTDGVAGSEAEGETAEEKEERENSATVHCADCKMDNDTTAKCGQLTDNEGATLTATRKFDVDMLFLRPPRHHFWGECTTHKRKPNASKAATAPE